MPIPLAHGSVAEDSISVGVEGALPPANRTTRLRICEVTPYPLDAVSGVATVVTDLTRRFRARGHPTVVLAPRSDRDSESSPWWCLPADPPFANARIALRAALTLFRRRHEWDLLHVHQAHPLTLATGSIARILGRPVVGTLHLIPPTPRGLRGLVQGIVSKMTLALLVERIFVSARTREEFRSWGLVIRNGVDVDGIRAGLESRDAVRRRLRLDGFTVAFAGRRCLIKGYADLLEALSRARATGADIRLLASGQTAADERDELDRRIESLHLAPYVVDVGERADHLALLGAADAFVLPSYREGFPMALLEAMACGLPVLATEVGGISELIQDDENGLLVRPGDIDALAEGLRRLASSPALRARLASRAAETVRAFDSEKVANSYLDVFSALMRTRAPDAGVRAR